MRNPISTLIIVVTFVLPQIKMTQIIIPTYNTIPRSHHPLHPPRRSTAATSSSPVPSIVVVLTTTFSLTFLFLIHIKHCNDTNTFNVNTNFRPSHVRKNSSVDHDVLEALPIFRFGSLRGQMKLRNCAVCLARFEDPEVLRLLPKCKHAFHVSALPLQG
ncbi:hypothetical protein JHK82_040432 [Glycine max]|nr:hypothetical protein JHK87_040444 [Glycine soja]KAG5111209.1 hypothetical protein JHK82_040432 [Glycine max]KAG5122500.1 hypothetical protein JHK84_040840 [Glycine max]KAH1095127.1 hypothetical protein GYH30_040431 [Glycine max]